MVTAVIVAEYNPFHNGHAYHAAKAREAGASHLIAVMSGNFSQRGSGTVLGKRHRAQAALLGGVDLVLELPLPYAMAPAQHFAEGAMRMADATGCADMLIFGSESGYISIIRAAAAAVAADDTQKLLREIMADGTSFAKARQLAVSRLYGDEIADMLTTPNDTLGVEYVRALDAIGSGIMPYAVLRTGAAHDAGEGGGGIASASYIRSLMRGGDLGGVDTYVPSAMAEVFREARAEGLAPFDDAAIEVAVLAALRRMSPAALAALPDISEGLENRLYRAIRQSTGLGELCARVKTKRITAARIRRVLMAAFLGLPAGMAEQPPPYIRVLGFNGRGREVLSVMRTSAKLPVSDQLAYLYKLGGEAARFASLESTATDLYTLALPKRQPCGSDYTAGSVRV